jgi:hypothetical protein
LRHCACRRGGSTGCKNGASARIDHRLPPLSLHAELPALSCVSEVEERFFAGGWLAVSTTTLQDFTERM